MFVNCWEGRQIWVQGCHRSNIVGRLGGVEMGRLSNIVACNRAAIGAGTMVVVGWMAILLPMQKWG